jgi:hypothetical protein
MLACYAVLVSFLYTSVGERIAAMKKGRISQKVQPQIKNSIESKISPKIMNRLETKNTLQTRDLEYSHIRKM